MKSYKKLKTYLIEGGNVVIKGNEASRINLKELSRDEVVANVDNVLKIINDESKKVTGVALWNDKLFKSKKFLSGSAYHFFMTNSIPNDEFVNVKSSVGDIDTQVNVNQYALIKSFLDKSVGKLFGDAKFLGYKESTGQFITLWKFNKLGINIQIDLELVEFDKNGNPTDWSQFSHSSAWEDLKEGIKGYHHKMLLQALDAPKFQTMIIKAKSSRGKDKTLFRSTHAFSVSHGIREKMVPVFDNNGKPVLENGVPQFKELKTTESRSTKDLSEIYYYFFGHVPSKNHLDKMFSFVGIINLIKEYFPRNDWAKISDEYILRIWGKTAQGLYRANPQLDLSDKVKGATYLTKELGVDINKYSQTIQEYYKNYK